jgi:hypothetical protein
MTAKKTYLRDMIAFNDSYEAEGFLKGVSFINEHLKSYGIKVVEEFIDDDDLYNSIDEEFAYELKIMSVSISLRDLIDERRNRQ